MFDILGGYHKAAFVSWDKLELEFIGRDARGGRGEGQPCVTIGRRACAAES